MATPNHVARGALKPGGKCQPQLPESLPKSSLSTTPPTGSHHDPTPIDPKDPENFLRRCCGTNKKTKARCGVSLTRSPQDFNPTYLPTCKNHREPKSFAGRCQFYHSNGEKCDRLFRWKPPLLELCPDHEGQSDMPCHLLRLPLELRYEIFRYLLPSQSIGSSTAIHHSCFIDDDQTLGDSFTHVQNLDENARQALLPPELDESVRAVLLGAPISQFRAILSAYARNLRRNRSAPNGSSHSCYRCSRYTGPYGGQPSQKRFRTQYPMPINDLFRICKQIYQEAKELLYSTVAFTIDIRRDGTFMCGRRLLEPRGPDGSSPTFADGTDEAKNRFIRTFDWAAVKNYNVDIVIENQPRTNSGSTSPGWDEEVEIYDIRDYVAVVVSGILGKSRNLCKLQVRLCLDASNCAVGKVLENTKLLAGPFERLRNVRQPRFVGVFHARSSHNDGGIVIGPERLQRSGIAICSVPTLIGRIPVLMPCVPAFGSYATEWERCISSAGRTAVVANPPIRAMFTEFKDWYSRLAKIVRNVAFRPGRQAFLHRARVAREHEDVEAFRILRNELIQYWYAHLEQEEQMRNDMNARMSRMLDTDIYPSSQYLVETNRTAEQPSNASKSLPQPSAALDVDVMTREGIPMTGNHSLASLRAAQASAMYRAHRYNSSNQCTSFIHDMAMQPDASHQCFLPQIEHITARSRDWYANPLDTPERQKYLKRSFDMFSSASTAASVPASAPASAPAVEPRAESPPPPPPPPPSDDWASLLALYDAGGPGPSTRERRANSGTLLEEVVLVDLCSDEDGVGASGGGGGGGGDAEGEEGEQAIDDRRDSAAYAGKGKGKMVVG